jgi:uncharacterized protein (DUF58 family)
MSAALSALTTRGRAFLSAGIACSVCAIVLGQRDLLRVGLLLLALPAITAVVTSRSRYLLSCAREVTPQRVQVGDPAVVSLTLENPGRVPTGVLLLEDSVPYTLGSRPRFVVDQLRPRWKREMSYQVRSQVRGRFALGPLTVRLTDPFGFVELTRSFRSQATVVVTPTVVPLPRARLYGDWSGAGDDRPRAFAAAGTEDVTVREYRLGDDLRRIHWPSTARTDQLMVRREEQPHQSRATLFVDTRAAAHRGTGPRSSFEYAVSCAASVTCHLGTQGFAMHLLTDSPESTNLSPLRGVGGEAEVELILDALAVVTPSRCTDFSGSSGDYGANGLVIAVLGATSELDVAALRTLQSGATRALAIVLDVAAWAGPGTATAPRSSAAQQRADLLRSSGWSVAVAGPGDRIDAVWQELTSGRQLARGGAELGRSTMGGAA